MSQPNIQDEFLEDYSKAIKAAYWRGFSAAALIGTGIIMLLIWQMTRLALAI